MTELGAISDLTARAANYAHLRFAADTEDEANGALVAKVSELATAIETKLVFFDLEWAEIDDAVADRLLESDGLELVRHHLRTARRYRPHLLSEAEEKLMAEKSVTGRDAWSRLFSEQTSAIRVELPDADEAVPLDAALSRLQHPDRETRRDRGRGRSAPRSPRAAHARLHLQHARAGQGRRRPAAQLLHLALEPQPQQRGQRRVGARAARGDRGRLRRAAALVPAEGAGAGPRAARRLRPRRRDRRRRGGVPLGGRDRPSCRRPTRASPPCSATSSRASSTSSGSTRPRARASAAARSAPTRRRASTPT